MNASANRRPPCSLVATCFSILAGLADGSPARAAQTVPGEGGVAERRAVVRFADIVPGPPPPQQSTPHPAIPHGEPVPAGGVVEPLGPASGAPLPRIPAVDSPAPAESFRALGDNDTRIPPDTHGAVGHDHLMITLNSQVRLQTRAGATLQTVSLQDFWGPVGPFSTQLGAFDPRVFYDPFTRRWITSASADPAVASASVLIGVSQSADPAGLWNLYRIDVDPANLLWADFPNVGFNKDWIVVQANIHSNQNNDFVRSDILAFDKADLTGGGAGRYTRFMDTTGGSTTAPAQSYSSTLSALFLLESWNANFNGRGYLRLSTITGPVGGEVLTTGIAYPSSPDPWDYGPPGFVDLAPQLGSARKIQLNDDRLYSVVYRDGSLWAAHTVFYPATGGATRSSIQWWEVNVSGAAVQRGVIDDPSQGRFYAYPSIAVNRRRDVLVGYSRFSAQQYASGNYSFRSSGDPPNSLRGDVVLKAGEAPYYKIFGGTLNRWGDYSQTVVDPRDDLALWTIQEYAATPIGSSRWGTWWGKVVPEPIAPALPAGWLAAIAALLVGAAARALAAARPPADYHKRPRPVDSSTSLT